MKTATMTQEFSRYEFYCPRKLDFKIYPRFCRYFLYNSTGNIGEDALQNLNLVINLTKHIQVKANANNDDVDSEEYSEYFPSFMWIVRDFTLQLVGEDDENLNANQYLEKALEEQKGFSDKIEEKNRIRRLLKTFFKERQCFTMIRPITNEEALQNLEEMEEKDLRQDFLEQVVQLRKKVLHGVKPKLLNGKQLSPNMFITLAESYVTSINKGAVPNIENAWTYICQNESKKSLEKAIVHFDEFLNDQIFHYLPMEENDLRERFKEAKDESKQIFIKNSVGGVSNEHLEELKFQIQQKMDKVFQENERECQLQCDQFLDSAYEGIYKKLNKGEFADFYEYESHLKEFQQYYYSEAPSGPMRNDCLYTFINDKLIESIDYFIKRLSDQMRVNQELSEEQIRTLQSQIEDLKKRKSQEQDEFETKIKDLSLEKAQCLARVKTLEETLQTEQESFSKKEAELKERYKRDKSDYELKIEKLKNKEEEFKKRENEINRLLMTEKSEFEKQNLLLVQQVEHLQKNIEELKKREDSLKKEMEEEVTNMQKTARGKHSEYENELTTLRNQNDIYRDQINELENKLEAMRQQHEYKLSELEEMKESNVCSSEEYVEIQDALEKSESARRQEREELHSSFKQVQDQLSSKIVELEEHNKQLQQTLDNERSQFVKDKAIFEQKDDFMKHNIQTLEQQIKAKEKENSNLIEMIGANESNVEELRELEQKFFDYKRQVEEDKEKLEKEMSVLKAGYEEKLADLNNVNYELEKNYNLLKSDYDNDTEGLKEEIEALKKENLEATQGSETSRLQFTEDSIAGFQKLIKSLESELSTIRSEHQRDLDERQQKSTQMMEELRVTYDKEKQNLEKRLKELKDKNRKAIQELTDEFEREKQDNEREFNEKIDNMEMYITDLENKLNDQSTEFGHQLALTKQKCEHYEAQLKEKRSQQEQEALNQKKQFDAQIDQASQEKKDLLAQIYSMSQDIIQKNMKIEQLEGKGTKLDEEMNSRFREIEEEKQALQNQKEVFEEKLKTLEAENSNLDNTLTQLKMKYEKDLALLKQDLSFTQAALAETKSSKDKEYGEQDQKLAKKTKEIATLTEELAKLEKKYKETRIAFQLSENTLQSKIADLEKESCILKERSEQLESKVKYLETFKDNKEKYEKELEELRQRQGTESSDYLKEKTALVDENKSIKTKLEEVEKNLTEKFYALEKENALLFGRCEFFENSNNELKKENKELQEKMQKTFDQLAKKKTTEKSKIENSQKAIMDTMNEQNNSKVNELKERYKKEVTELDNKAKNLEKEAKFMKEKLQKAELDLRNLQSSYNKEIKKYQVTEEKLREEIDILRKQSESSAKRFSVDLVSNVESLNQRNKELEAVLNEKREECNKLELNLRTKESHYQSQINDQKEEIFDLKNQIEQIKKKNDNLDSQLRKFKDSQRNTRKGGYGPERSSSNFGKGATRPSYSKFTSQMHIGQSSNGSSVNGSQKENFSMQRHGLGSKFISDSLGKTTNFDQLSTNKSQIPLGRNVQQLDTDLSQNEYRDEDDE